MEKHWYVVHTYSGYENKVKENIEKRIASMGMEDFIFRVLVPSYEETTITKSGATKVKQKKLYPGYVMVEMIQTDEAWYVIRNTPQVTGFLGSSGGRTKPHPLKDYEVKQIFDSVGIEEPVYSIDLIVKDMVKIKDGSFKDFVGTVEEIDFEKAKLKVIINMFGREMPVDFDFSQIEKVY